MIQIDYIIQLWSGDLIEMEGQLDPPPHGLAVNVSKVRSGETYNVTHIPSGKCVGCLRSFEQAIAFMRSIMGIVDWSMSETRIKSMKNIKDMTRQVHELERRYLP